MRIVFAGTPELALPGIVALQKAGHEIVGIITRADAPIGRKKVITPSPVGQFADYQGIPVLKKNFLNEDDVSWVKDLDADLGVIIAYGGLLKKDMLKAPKKGWINLHFSDLPKWRGAAPVQRALMAKETNIGVSVFKLVTELDAGDVIAKSSWEFTPGTTAGEVLSYLADKGSDVLVQAVEILANDQNYGVAQKGEISYAHKLSRDDARLDFKQNQADVIAVWAGVTPTPGAWVLVDGQPFKIHDLRAAEADDFNLKPGEVMLQKNKVICGTADKPVELLRVQPAGKQTMEAVAWLRGRKGKATLE